MSEDELRQTNLRRRYDTDLRNEFERNADAIEEIRKDLQRIERRNGCFLRVQCANIRSYVDKVKRAGGL